MEHTQQQMQATLHFAMLLTSTMIQVFFLSGERYNASSFMSGNSMKKKVSPPFFSPGCIIFESDDSFLHHHGVYCVYITASLFIRLQFAVSNKRGGFLVSASETCGVLAENITHCQETRIRR